MLIMGIGLRHHDTNPAISSAIPRKDIPFQRRFVTKNKINILYLLIFQTWHDLRIEVWHQTIAVD